MAASDRIAAGAERTADAAREGARDVLAYSFELGQFTVTLGGVVAALVTLLLVWFAARAMQRGFNRYASRREISTRAAIYTVAQMARYLLFAIGLILALGMVGIPITRLAFLAGAIGVGLGFGLQAIFSNFISGIILLFDRSLKVGDFVELESGLNGEVRDINIRATLIATNDNIDILVPNSEFVTGRVVNWTHGEGARRLRVPFGVAYGSDKELVKKAALEAAEEVPFTLARQGPRRPQVWLVGFGDSSLEFELVVWLTPEATRRPGAVKAAYNWALETALAAHDLEIPFPQRDLNIRTLFGLQGEAALAAFHDRSDGPSPSHRHAAADGGDELTATERADLSRNDALEDVEVALREEAARRQAEEAEVARAERTPPAKSDPNAG